MNLFHRNIDRLLTYSVQIAIFTTPLGVLTIKGWAGWHLFISALLTITILILAAPKWNPSYQDQKAQVRALAWIFTLPLLATLLAQLLRNQINLSDLDAPARFVFAIPILYGLLAANINTARLLSIAIPLSLIATYLILPYLPQKGWALDTHRLASYSVDPLTFGKIALGLGLMSIFIAIENAQKKLLFITALIGGCLGIYLSIQSQSRTGWLGVILVILFLALHLFNKETALIKKLIGSAILLAVSIAFMTNPKVLSRANQAITDIQTWQPSQYATDSSVGFRLSFWMIGGKLYLEEPIKGWGNDGFKNRLQEHDFVEMANQYTRDFTVTAGFHSDIMQNAVRSGTGGLVAYLSIFFMPLYIFIRSYYKYPSSRTVSGLGIIYALIECVSSLSTEVLSLKSTASFYGLMLAILIAGSINSIKHIKQ